jgi:hypothetical protein
MSYTTDDLAALERALASGVMRVRYSDGKEVTYRSTDELLRAIAVVKGQMAQAAGAPRTMSALASFTRG